jgi:hypothetical protein
MKSGTLLVSAFALLLAFASAHAATYTAAGANEIGIGAQPPNSSQYDILNLSSVTSSISGSGTYLLNNVSFSVGVNCTTCPSTTGSISETLTIGGDAQTITIPWSWSSTGPTDTINLLSNGSYSFDAGLYTVSVLAAGPFSAGLNNTAHGVLDMVVTQATPLPAALSLFATGLGGLGLLGWSRKRKAQAVA